jgi:hypothetical protein
MVLGDMLGDVMRVLRKTGTWTPLRMVSAVLGGTTIVVTFERPADPIVADTDWVKAIGNLGFSFTDDDTSATVSSAAITGPEEVTLTLSGAPTGANPVVRYGIFLPG